MIADCKILIADDQKMIRMGLKMNVQFMLGYHTIDEAATLKEVLYKLDNASYTHLILDIIFPDGISLEAVPHICKAYPDLRVLIFSMQPAEIYARSVEGNGHCNYLHKNSSEEEILDTLEKFLSNQLYPPKAPPAPSLNPFIPMTLTELTVLHYYLNRYPMDDIAEKLMVPADSVAHTMQTLHTKTSTRTLQELTTLAMMHRVSY